MRLSLLLTIGMICAIFVGPGGIASAQEFRRGDLDGDGRVGTISDFQLLNQLFLFPPPVPPVHPCADAWDVNDDGLVNFDDFVPLIEVMLGDTPPLLPGPSSCGVDPTPDNLDCSNYDCTMDTQADFPEAVLTLGQVAGSIGELVSVELSTAGAPTAFLTGIEMSVIHDPAIARVVSVEVLDSASGETVALGQTLVDPGIFRAHVVSSFTGIPRLAPVALIATYEILAPGQTSLSFSDVPVRAAAIGNGSGRPTLNDGSITVVEILRGDANGDATVDIGDAVFLLAALFSRGDPWQCADAADSNDDGLIDLGDPIATLAFLFSPGPGLPAPGALNCGTDLTIDALFCEVPTCP